MGKNEDRVKKIKQNEEAMFDLYVKLGQNKFLEMLDIPVGNAVHILGKEGLDWYDRREEVLRLREKLRYNNWLDLDNKETWYFIGYFLGDGSLRHRGDSYRVNVWSADKEPISSFAKKFKTEVSRVTNSGQGGYSLDIYSKEIYEFLYKIGMRDRKSYNGCQLQSPPTGCIGDFLRGLLDSDGFCRFNSTKQVVWYGHPSYMCLVSELLSQVDIKYSRGIRADGLEWVSVSSFQALEDLFYLLYDKEDCLKLQRKYDRFEQWMISRSNIEEIVQTGEEIPMMDMEVEDVHKFYANNVLVMNCAQELRVIANLTGQPEWVHTFLSDGDMHRTTAEAIWGKENYNKHYRKLAKTINFGIAYGMSGYSLAQRIGVSPEEGEEIITKYWKANNKQKAFNNMCVRIARKTGTIHNYFGLPRRVRFYLNSSDPKMRAFGIRTVNNTVIQSFGAGLLKMSMVKLWKYLGNPEYYKFMRFQNTIHDEINFAVKKDKIMEAALIVRKCMGVKFPNLPVPFITGCDIGNRWGSTFPFKWDKDADGNDILVPDDEEVKE